MEYGLKDEIMESMTAAFTRLANIEKVILYGSRAKGTYTNGSDIDIVLFGNDLNLNNCVYPLMDELDELCLPYSFDISIYNDINNVKLTEHIDRVGKILYNKVNHK